MCVTHGARPWPCNSPRVEIRALRRATARTMYRWHSRKRSSSVFKRSSTSLRSRSYSRTCARPNVRSAERRLNRVFFSRWNWSSRSAFNARLDDLEFLPSGDTALTRRATKYSGRVAVVVRFSRSRGRYERQGVLVETAGLEKAERECLEDADERAKARAHGDERRRKQDVELAAQMTQKIATLFPGCPASEVAVIAEHTAQRGSGRVGRTEAGRNLAENALTLAVIAAIRHKHTPYDE